MLNQCILVGKIISEPIKEIIEKNQTKTRFTLEIKRSFKNPETQKYDSDFVIVNLMDDLASSTYEHLR